MSFFPNVFELAHLKVTIVKRKYSPIMLSKIKQILIVQIQTVKYYPEIKQR